MPLEVVPAGLSQATVLPDMDFETYSESGYWWDADNERWRSVAGQQQGGLPAVGAPAYAEHPSTEILSLAYDLKDGNGPRLWLPHMVSPADLHSYIQAGGIIEAWNSAFEWYIWNWVAVPCWGWPPLPYWQTRDAAAKARAFSLPGRLEKAGAALGLDEGEAKLASEGKRLLNKFSKPRNPSKHDKATRRRLQDEPVEAARLYEYNLRDIKAESAVSCRCPDLSPGELQLWLQDQLINFRGVHIDQKGVDNCAAIIDQAHSTYTGELVRITGGAVDSAGQRDRIMGWLAGRGVNLPDLQADTIEDTLAAGGLPDDARRVMEIRASLGSQSVKKLGSIRRRVNSDGRLRDLYAYFGADRTGRFAGRGPQPQNLPGSGPPVVRCDPHSGCGRHYRPALDACPWCGAPQWASSPVGWSVDAAEDALRIIASRDLTTVEHYFGDAVATVSGCLRALFTAAPGCDLICSDYVAIEGVVTAVLAGEEWRLEVFRTHGMIYEASASVITGTPMQEFIDHKERTGEHHPLRKKVGKFAELASGFGGWIGAWKQFGADEYLSDQEIKEAVLAWRKASPRIVEMWGGQVRQTAPWQFRRELYGLEGAAIAAVLEPGKQYSWGRMAYFVQGDVLYCKLPSERHLTYHQPRLTSGVDRFSGLSIYNLSYMGWNNDSRRGPIGWARLHTYGGKLTENVVQAVARDIFTYGMLNAERAGYPVVLHTHDELACEVVENTGSVHHLEQVMSQLPDWCRGWPVRVAGGWRGKRYRKD